MKQINQFDNAEEFFELPNSWRDKGREEGRKEGLEKGLEQGELAAKEEIARKSLVKHIEIDVIMELTELPIERILEIKKEFGL